MKDITQKKLIEQVETAVEIAKKNNRKKYLWLTLKYEWDNDAKKDVGTIQISNLYSLYSISQFILKPNRKKIIKLLNDPDFLKLCKDRCDLEEEKNRQIAETDTKIKNFIAMEGLTK